MRGIYNRLMIVLWSIVGIWFALCALGALNQGRIPWEGVVVGLFGVGVLASISLLKWVLVGTRKD